LSEFADKVITPPKSARRIEALDLARGLALFAMASYHFCWNLEQFGYLEAGATGQGWLKLYARSIAGSFLFLAGVSLALAHGARLRPRPFLKRLGMIAGAAAVITIVTLYVTPDSFIFFGILHAIALSSVIGLAFLRVPGIIVVAVGAACLALPQFYRDEMFNTPWLYWVGLFTVPPRSNDFVPLAPWLGPFLIGLGLAKLAIRQGMTDWFRSLETGDNAASRLARYCGRHSLAFYLLHQPVLLALVWATAQIAPAEPVDPVSAFISDCRAGCAVENEAGYCLRFCGCVTDELLSRGLFNDFIAGKIAVDTDSRINDIANHCTVTTQP
jgi:uncharacterized membrane protein